MLEENTVTPSQAQSASTLMFKIFVYVADAGDALTAREVEKLQSLFSDPSWCHDPLLRQGLNGLKTQYAELWREYQRKGIKRDVASIANRIRGLVEASTDKASFWSSLEFYLDAISSTASPVLVRLGLVTRSAEKAKALSELKQILEAAKRGQQEGREAQLNETSVDTINTKTVEITAAQEQNSLACWPAAGLKLQQEHLWKRGRCPVRCIAVIPETHDVRTFVFQARTPCVFAYQPGQFITLELPIGGKTVKRSYTISSSPSRPYAISITVKRVAGGLVSNWLHENMQVGFEFFLSGPHGEFTCFAAPSQKLLLIAAGSGVTPIMSMLRWLADTASSVDIVFINNVRTPADVIFREELAYLGTRLGPMARIAVVPSAALPGHSWPGSVGHFSETLVRLMVPDLLERQTFVCGPPAYMDAVRGTLERMGLAAEQYHQESFGGSTTPIRAKAPSEPNAAGQIRSQAPDTKVPVLAPSAAPIGHDEEPQKVEVVFSRSGKRVTATSADYILDVAEENGVQLDSSCRAGTCGTCKVKRIDGKVDMDGQQALSETELADDLVLLCVGRACSSTVVLEA